ncbi:MAG: recombinase family protein [Caldilineaceae bacterium]|nr:recombinase family protein [Caldilineaceae bacterium]
MLGIKAALGKIESDNIRERMIMGRRARLERGEVPGGDQVKYGYASVDKYLEICDEEATIVRRIFDWYIAGENSMTVRSRLNSEGVPPRRSKLWSKATIGKILTGEFYATGKIPTSLDGEDFEIPCPTIISMAVWEKAQIIRKGNKNKARNVKRDYLCLGIVYCACGWKCNVRTVRSNRSRGYETVSGVYACQRYGTSPETQPQNCAVCTGSKKVDNHVWNFVKQICSAPQLVQNAIEAKVEQLETERIDLEGELEELTSKLEQLGTERNWVITQARKGRITEKDMEFQLGQIELHEQALRSAMGKYEAIQIARNQANVLTNWADQYLSNIQKGIAALEVDVETLDTTSFNALYTELSASRFSEKFPGDRKGQLKWAILEEKRKTVRTLIDKVIVGRGKDGHGRTIVPICALDLPLDLVNSLDSGDQSLEYINSRPDERAMVLGAA